MGFELKTRLSSLTLIVYMSIALTCPLAYSFVESNQFNLCQELRAGDSKIIYFEGIFDLKSPTPISTNYRLTRVSSKRFKSEVPVFFEAGESVTDLEVLQLRDKVKSCLLEASQFLRNSKGDSLEIVIPENLSDFSKVVRVTVVRQIFRENARTFGISSSCATIIHEMLHHHGLVDEYTETSLKNADGSVVGSCRAIGAQASIMSDSEQAYRQVKLRNFDILKIEVCPTKNSSDTNSSDCQQIHSEVPVGQGFNTAQMKKYGATLMKRETASRNSLLGDKQFEAIVRPGCLESSLYQICASNAYLSKPNCNPVPIACSEPYKWTGVKSF